MFKYRLHELYAAMMTRTGYGIWKIKRAYMEDRRRRHELENAKIGDAHSMSDAQIVWTAEYFGITQEEVFQPNYLKQLKRQVSLDLV